MTEFGVSATLDVELDPQSAAKARAELEEEFGSIPFSVEGGRVTAGGGSPGLADGGVDYLSAIASLEEDQRDLLDDLVDEVEAGALGGSGGGGGGGLDPLSFLAGRGLAGGGGGAGTAGLLARILGPSSAATAITLPQFGVRTQGGIQNPEDVEVPPSTDLSDQDMLSIYDQAGVGFQGADGQNPISQVFNTEPAETSPGSAIQSIFTQSPRDGGGAGGGPGNGASSATSRRNKAKEKRLEKRGDTNIDVTVNVESVRKDVERAMRDAKREVARKVAQKINQEIAGTTSRTGL
jgi:hypothetical protein